MTFENEQDKQIIKQALMSAQVQGKDARTLVDLIEKVDQAQIDNSETKATK